MKFKVSASVFFVTLMVSNAQISVLNFGDSLTLQSADDLVSQLGPDYDLHSLTSNARNSANGVANINSWLNDPDSNPSTDHPTSWDIVRFNHGIWDALPTGNTGITSTSEYIDNLSSIVSAIQLHSPNAQIIFSTSPLVDPNRVTLDPLPATSDYAAYNISLTNFRNAVLASSLPSIPNVTIDDKFLFYSTNSPSDFPSLPSPSRSNTGVYWHWDGVHFDNSYRNFEALQTSNAIRAVSIPEPSSLLFLGASSLGIFIRRRRL